MNFSYEFIDDTVINYARSLYRKTLSHTSGGHNKIVLLWVKDTIVDGRTHLDFNVTGFPNVAALQQGINCVIDNIIEDELITHDPPSQGRIIYIFALEKYGCVFFTMAKNILRGCRPADLPLFEAFVASSPDPEDQIRMLLASN